MTLSVHHHQEKEEDFLSRLAKQDRFYSRMIHLIPRDLYLHTHSSANIAEIPTSSSRETEDGMSSNKKRKQEVLAEPVVSASEKYYKHRKQPLTADEKKLRSQQNKKAKYSSENAKIDEDEEDGNAMEEEDGDDNDASSSPAMPTFNPESNEKIEELRKRLQDRIANLKNQRLPTKKKPTERPQTKKPVVPNKPNGLKNVKSEDSIEELKAQLAFQQDDHESHSVNSVESGPLAEDLEFGTVLRDSSNNRSHPAKKDGGKVQRIKKLLQEAEKKRERLKALTASKEEADQKKAKSEQWQDVLKTAAGEKALVIDPTTQGVSKAEMKLKKALKRREKLKAKSAEAWQGRLDQVADEKAAKQATREENIKNRKLQRHGEVPPSTAAAVTTADNKKKPVPIARPGQAAAKDNKANKNEDGGKKGRNRAGFEGKKTSFLNAAHK